MRIASTTVPTSFEHDSMMTFRLRSTCINSFSVSRPFISGINTSRMMKSGRSPLFTFSSASFPELTVSTSNPSTSSKVCKYFRMLGSSSTTRIFSFTAIDFPFRSEKTFGALALIHWQQKRKPTSCLRLARYPDLSAMCLNEPFRDRQPQTHSRRISVHAYKIFKYLLMMLGRDTRPRIRHAYFHAVWARQPEPAPFFHWSQGSHSPFPEMWCGPQRYAATARRVLQGVIKEIRSRLLHLLIIESECRNGRVKARVQLDPFTLKRLRPALGKFIQTVSQIVLAELQHQFPALQSRVVQEHRHQTHQAFATVLGLFQNIPLFVRQTPERTGQKKIVITLDHCERRFQFVRR